MKLIILGSGTSIMKKDRLASGYLIELDSGKSLLFDCGGTVAQQLVNINFDYTKLDHILISHPHPDHMGGLISLLHAICLKSLFFPKYRRKKPLLLHGYSGFKKAYKTLRKTIIAEPIEEYPIKIVEYKNQRVKYPGFTLKTKIVLHAEKLFNSVALRLEADNKVFVYSGDSRYCDALIKLAKGADLFLCDSSSLEEGFGNRRYHLTPRGAGKIAQDAGVKKLMLTHHFDIKPPKQVLKQAKEYFPGKIILAEDLMRVRI